MAKKVLSLVLVLFSLMLSAQNEFITTWRTTVADKSITIPTTGTGYNYSVDWGDGSVESGFNGDASHTYSTAGDYQVKISGEFPRIFFNNNADSDKIQSVDQWGTIAWTSFVNAFNDCKQLKILAIDAPDLSNVTDLGSAFKACRAIGNPDLSNWDVSGITNMNSLFFFSNFNGDVTTWDVGSVTNFAAMFAQTPFNQDISGWNIGERVSGNSITMSQMFALAKSFSYNIGGWDMSKVINALQMLRSTDSFDYDLGGWDISNMVEMTDFLNSASLSSINYDNTLIGLLKTHPTKQHSLLIPNIGGRRSQLKPTNWTSNRHIQPLHNTSLMEHMFIGTGQSYHILTNFKILKTYTTSPISFLYHLCCSRHSWWDIG